MKLVAEYENVSSSKPPFQLNLEGFYCRDEMVRDVAVKIRAHRVLIDPTKEKTFRVFDSRDNEYDISFYKEWLGETNQDFGVLASPYLLRAVIGVAARNAQYKPFVNALRRANTKAVRLVEDIKTAWRIEALPESYWDAYGWMGLQNLIRKTSVPEWAVGSINYPDRVEAIEVFPPAQFL